MKKILFIGLLLSFIIISVFKVDASPTVFPLIGHTIVLDAGHGGKDLGAKRYGTDESSINLGIVLKIKELLELNGANVILTRKSEKDLSNPNALYRKKSDFDNRIKIINNSHADLYLSIHQNIYNDSKYYGPQVFYYSKITDNEKIADLFQNSLNRLANTNRKTKIITGTYMYDKINIKGVLIECGFLSNKRENNLLKTDDYQRKVAYTIVKTIINYFS